MTYQKIWRTCRDEDISNVLCTKTETDIHEWLANTENMLVKLTMHPDPTKGDPYFLIKKLSSRIEQMKAHLKKRRSVPLTTGYGIGKEKLTLPIKSMPMKSMPGSSGSVETSLPVKDQIWAYAAPPIDQERVPPPHKRPETNLDALIAASGVIHVVDKEEEEEVDTLLINDDKGE